MSCLFHISWPKYWSFSSSINPSNEYLGLISFRTDWFDFCAVQGILESSLAPQFESVNVSGTQPPLWSNTHIHTWLLWNTLNQFKNVLKREWEREYDIPYPTEANENLQISSESSRPESFHCGQGDTLSTRAKLLYPLVVWSSQATVFIPLNPCQLHWRYSF